MKAQRETEFWQWQPDYFWLAGMVELNNGYVEYAAIGHRYNDEISFANIVYFDMGDTEQFISHAEAGGYTPVIIDGLSPKVAMPIILYAKLPLQGNIKSAVEQRLGTGV